MKKILLNNLWLKIGALVLAVLIWMFVINAANPYEIATISSIPITFLNEDKYITQNNLVYTPITGNTVSIKVDKQAAHRIGPSDFTATVDFKDYAGADKDEKFVKIVIEPNDSILNYIDRDSIKFVSNEYFRFKLESIYTKEYEVKINQVGTLPEGFTFGLNSLKVTPLTVKISGPESELGAISYVRVNVDLSEYTSETFEKSYQIELVNANDKPIEISDRINLSTSQVLISSNILKQGSMSISVSGTSGSVRDGYRIRSITLDKHEVQVAGLAATIQNTNYIEIPAEAINVSGRTESFSLDVNLNDYAPDGIVIEEEASKVNILVAIEQLKSQTFYVPTSSISMTNGNDDFNYTFASEKVGVTLVGFADELESIKLSDISTEVDLTDLAQGRHTVSLKVTVPAGFEQATSVTTTIEVTDSKPGGNAEAKTISASKTGIKKDNHEVKSTEN